jgi:hypothetical protein
MPSLLSPLHIGLIAAGVAALVVAAAVSALSRRHPTRSSDPGPHGRSTLPQGADAALWSILEVIPDPRNHLALTRDLTGEVRLTPSARQTLRTLRAARDVSRAAHPSARGALPSAQRPTSPTRSAERARRRASQGSSGANDGLLVLTGQIFDD